MNLPSRGLDNYVKDPSFRVLMAALHIEEDFVQRTKLFDFVQDKYAAIKLLADLNTAERIYAHNASFERAVLKHLYGEDKYFPLYDTAAIARMCGAGSSLAAAAPQLLDENKMESGTRLIQKFSIPSKTGTALVDTMDTWSTQDKDDWKLFGEYCILDAELSHCLGEGTHMRELFNDREHVYEELTQNMNDTGWYVDLDLVERMQEQYQRNLVQAENDFQKLYDPDKKLNFRSTPQLRKWCAERGVRASSFDELSVKKLLARIEKRLDSSSKTLRSPQTDKNLTEVKAMLTTKQILGGSSLSKLEAIKNQVSADGRLRGQYLHAGAGQTFRTSGRGVQLQNLKRLGKTPEDVEGSLEDWSNKMLANNLRQVFRAEHPQGELIVSDYSSIESRALAYIAGADWKLNAYRQGRDMYKVLASAMFGVPYGNVTSEQRQTGKVGELSCGYGAGPKAVQDFAEKMGVIFSANEAATTVRDWRATNTEVVELWKKLDDAIRQVVIEKKPSAIVTAGLASRPMTITFRAKYAPFSIHKMSDKYMTVMMQVRHYRAAENIVTRVFQGCYDNHGEVCYLKPSELKSGNPWLSTWTKDGQTGPYKLYGGKLTGILVQSYCREIFFAGLHLLTNFIDPFDNLKMVGQFHDEVVVEWTPSDSPNSVDLQGAKQLMKYFAEHPLFEDIPIALSTSSAHRYIK